MQEDSYGNSRDGKKITKTNINALSTFQQVGRSNLHPVILQQLPNALRRSSRSRLKIYFEW